MHRLAAPLALAAFACGPRDEPRLQSLLGPSFPAARLDAFIAEQMEAQQLTGLSLALINDGRVAYHTVQGFADKERQIPVTEATIFEGASISKSVFGHFVMTLVEDNVLDLDTPLHDYWPYPDLAHDERHKVITARMVLAHRTGLPNWRDDYPENRLFLQFDPGTDYHYSGEGYQYLALVIKHLLGTSWAGLEAEFQRRVAEPLQLQHTRFIQDDYVRQHKAVPYDKTGSPVDKSVIPWWQERDSVFVAPTTLHSEAIDFSRWVIAMMDRRGLSPTGFDALFATHSSVGANALLKSDYTLGFGKTTLLNSRVLFSHNGNNTGFSSLFLFDPERRWGLVYFTNSEFGDAFGNELMYGFLATGGRTKERLAVGGFGVASVVAGLTIFAVRRRRRAPAGPR